MKILHRNLLLALAVISSVSVLRAEEKAPVAVPPPARIGSSVFKWEDLKVKPTGVGERRDVADNPTPTLETFECHISTLNTGNDSHPSHTHPQEDLLILK